MGWIGLVMLFGPASPDAVPVQRPGDAVVWAFEWQAPAECPRREQVIEDVQGYLPRLEAPPGQGPRTVLQVEAELVANSELGSWSARVRIREAKGEAEAATEHLRQFSAPGCRELADATALIIAVALDPVLVTHEINSRAPMAGDQATSPDPDDPLPAVSDPVPTSPDPVPLVPGLGDARLVLNEPEPSSTSRSVRVGLRVEGGGGWGPTSTGYGAIGAGLAVFEDRWRWQLEGGWWIPREVAGARAGQFQGWWVGTRGCVVPHAGQVELPLCPGIELGQVLAEGIAPTANIQRQSYLWFAGVLGQGLHWELIDRIALTAEAALLISFTRGSFSIDGQQLQAVTPVGFRGVLGLELRL